MTVILAEGFIALLHLSGLLFPVALATAVVLLCGFALGVLAILKRGTTARCVCFGTDSGETISGKTLVRLALLLAAELALGTSWLFTQRAPASLQYGLAQLGPDLLCALVLLIAVSWFMSIPQIVAMRRASG